jgi:hypothetical protein
MALSSSLSLLGGVRLTLPALLEPWRRIRTQARPLADRSLCNIDQADKIRTWQLIDPLLILRDGTPVLTRRLVAEDVAVYLDFLSEVACNATSYRHHRCVKDGPPKARGCADRCGTPFSDMEKRSLDTHAAKSRALVDDYLLEGLAGKYEPHFRDA